MKTLLATCDRILAREPVAIPVSEMIGLIVIPEATRRIMEQKGMVELEIVSAGPDCKTASAGDRVIVAKGVCECYEWEGTEYRAFSERTALAIIKEQPDVATPSPVTPPVKSTPLTMDEIKTGLGIPSKPVDDASDLPVEPAPNAQPAQTAP